MAASKYLIQVVDADTKVVTSWAPGLDVERKFEAELVDRVVAKGVGVGCSEARVAAAVKNALHELLMDLKQQVPPG